MFCPNCGHEAEYHNENGCTECECTTPGSQIETCGLLHEWRFSSYSSSNFPNSHESFNFVSRVKPEGVPALVEKIKEMSGLGFIPASDTVSVWKNHSKDNGVEKPVSYDVASVFLFRNGDTTLIVGLKGIGDSLGEAIADVIVSHGSLKYSGDPVEGGKGQIKRCEVIANEIYKNHSEVIGCGCSVIVPYKTRGGRGGWKAKIAERSFQFNQQVPA